MADLFRGFGVEIKLTKPANFLVIKETLTRIGVPTADKRLEQVAYILHKQGRYVIIHEKELHAMDGDDVFVETDDLERRNKIVALLAEWDLLQVMNPLMIGEQASLSQIKILNFKEKNEWMLVPTYRFLEKKI